MVLQVSGNAINGIIDTEDMFNSNEDNYPWLALDLGVGFLYKVPVHVTHHLPKNLIYM